MPTPARAQTHAPSTDARLVPVESEESLVGCLLADPSTFVAIAESVNWRHFGDGKCKLIARAIWECVEDGLVISQANVIAKLQTIDTGGGVMAYPGMIDRPYLRGLDDDATMAVLTGAMNYAARIKTFANARYRRREALAFADQLVLDPEGSEDTTTAFMKKIADSRSASRTRSARARDIRASRDEAQTTGIGIPTGFRLLDTRIGGFKKSRIWAFLARFKGRKTTAAKALLLPALRAGNPVTYFLSADGTRDDLLNGFVAMLATAKLRTWGVPSSEWRIKAEGVPRNLRTEAQHQAITEAEAELDDLPLFIYDSRDKAYELETVVRLSKDRKAYDGCELFCYDYIQKIRSNNARLNDFQQYEGTVNHLDTFTREEQVTSLWLSQMNQDGIRQEQQARLSGHDNADDVTGTKWGPALQQAVDHMFIIRYDELRTPHLIEVFLRLTRWGDPFRQSYTMEPNSGLFLDPGKMPSVPESYQPLGGY
jgi:replicative DNA helicase